MIERILVPLDGSELAETVLPYAEYFSTRSGAVLRLLTVAETDTERTEANAYLTGLRDRLKDRAVEASVSVAPGEAAETVLTEGDAWNVDLIAMSTHGRSGVLRWVFGSVADKVVHASTRPLLLVRARPAKERPSVVNIERILVPLDGSELSLSVLPYVEDVARALGASLVLFNAVIPLDIYPAAEVSPVAVGGVLDDLLKQARSFLAEVEKEVEGRGVKARSVVTVGFPVDETVRVAQEVGAGLLAVATHGRSGLNRWVMGSVADGIVRRSALPCLMVRPQGAGQG
ncbi:MAG TPA: universal stress protein [Dehalococcoidia bacterium]|nr:universal stress protein [Dehalococcoidia bacterium]